MTEILIIEDDKGLNAGIAIGLGNENYHFTGCSTLAEARSAVRDSRFDLLILDLNLPDGNGYDFLREYRRQSDTPVLILTANDLEVNEVMGFELGANDYVTKPFSLAVLRARIENLLKISAGSRKITGSHTVPVRLFSIRTVHCSLIRHTSGSRKTAGHSP